MNMIEIYYTRLIAACVAAFLLAWGCYVTAYVRHKNEILDERNDRRLIDRTIQIPSEDDECFQVRVKKVESFYLGYRLALLGLYFSSAAIGWAAGWAVGQDYELSWVEDAAVAAAGAIIGGLVLDKYIIHPIADGSFFEKVETPIVENFLQYGQAVAPEVIKEKKHLFKKDAPAIEETAPAVELADHVPEKILPFDIDHMTFQEKVDLIDLLKKSL